MTTQQVLKGSEEGKIVSSTIKVREVGPNDVLIKIKACGLCFTDAHQTSKDMVLGHEPVGVIEKVGEQVKNYKTGDLVGWGYLHNSCLTCEFCLSGRDVLCPQRKMYAAADFDQGGFGEYYVADSRFISRIPEGLTAEEAAPLFCAGATVFSAIYNNKVSPTDHVGVIGVGGLGHLAVQFLSKWGCHVTTLSTSDSKKQEALKMGAHQHVITKVPKGEKIQIKEKLNYIFSTVDGQLPWDDYLDLLKPGGKLVVIGVGEGKMEHAYFPLIAREMSIGGSLVASRYVQNLMLEFAARHGIKPWIEVLPMDEQNLNTAFERLKKGDVKYRFVLNRQ